LVKLGEFDGTSPAHTIDSRTTPNTSTSDSSAGTAQYFITWLWSVDSIGFTAFGQRWKVPRRLDTLQIVFGVRPRFKYLNNY